MVIDQLLETEHGPVSEIKILGGPLFHEFYLWEPLRFSGWRKKKNSFILLKKREKSNHLIYHEYCLFRKCLPWSKSLLFYFIFSILKEPNQTGEGKCLTSAPTPQLPLSPNGEKKAEKHLWKNRNRTQHRTGSLTVEI